MYDSHTAADEIAYNVDGSRSLRGDMKGLQLSHVQPTITDVELDVDLGGNAGDSVEALQCTNVSSSWVPAVGLQGKVCHGVQASSNRIAGIAFDMR